MDGENVVKCLFAMLGQVVVSVLQVYSSSGLDELIERHVTFRTIQWQIEDTSLRNERLGSMHSKLRNNSRQPNVKQVHRRRN